MPVGVNEIVPTLKQMLESTHPYVDLHALTAVEALSTGRFQPLKENPEIFKLRMSDRCIGTKFEEKYANMTGQEGFPRWQVFRLRVLLFGDIFWTVIKANTRFAVRTVVKKLFGEKGFERLRSIKRRYFAAGSHNLNEPRIVEAYEQFNIIAYQGFFYGLPQSSGKVDFFDNKQLNNPLIIKAKNVKKVKRTIKSTHPHKIMSD